MNPRAAINDLLPFQGSPFGQLGYFSKSPYLLSSYLFNCLLSCESLFSITDVSLFVKNFFKLFSKFNFKFLTSGESGIRTHAPLRTNGFQDRLVMTTSISLHINLNKIVLHFRSCPSIKRLSLSVQNVFYHQNL